MGFVNTPPAIRTSIQDLVHFILNGNIRQRITL